jgi:glucokinase
MIDARNEMASGKATVRRPHLIGRALAWHTRFLEDFGRAAARLSEQGFPVLEAARQEEGLMPSTVLVGDVGGTHARFATAATVDDSFRLTERADLMADRFPRLSSALASYLAAQSGPKPGAIVLAVAGPVTGGAVRFTNHAWNTSETELVGLGFERAMLVNDFAALAFSVAALDPAKLRLLGPDLPAHAGESITVLGPGTGFGVSCLARFRGQTVPLATEGGHIGLAPGSDEEIGLVRILARRFGHVSVERVLSGPGLENIHSALAELHGAPVAPLAAEAVVAGAHASDPACRAAVDMFCALFGSVAGDFALAHGARGGVFIAGGIAPKIQDFLVTGAFRARFEAKGRMSDYVRAIPTRLILDPDAAFLGAAKAAQIFGLLGG